MNKNILAAVLAMAVSLSVNAENDAHLNDSITMYCNISGDEYQKDVYVGKGNKLYLNQGGFYQIQELNFVDPEEEFVRSQLSQLDIDKKCTDFLLSHSIIESVNNRDLIARVYFKFDQYNLTEQSKYVLDRLFTKIKSEHSIWLVEGHTDSTGIEPYNYQLGLKRANNVKVYLTEKGAISNKLIVSSKGESEPISSNETNLGREENRRVEILSL